LLALKLDVVKMTIFVADFGAPKTGLKSDEIDQISRLVL